MNSPVTFCVSCCNNLPYLKLIIESIRKYAYWKDAPFVVFSENSTDGSDEWLNENHEKYNLTTIIEHNDDAHTAGIGFGMNRTAELANTEYVMFLHADMFASKNFDFECLKIFDKYPNDKLWVNPQRFQPNCFKENHRPGTLFFDYDVFGYKHDDFQEDYFIQYAEEFSKTNPDIEVTKGEGVSGLLRTKDFLDIGGCDKQYVAYYDDADIFLRCRLAGYKFVITTNSVIWHFGSRSDKSNFPTDNIVRSERSKNYEMNSAKKFYNKWGFLPINDENGFVDFPPNVDKNSLKHLIKV